MALLAALVMREKAVSLVLETLDGWLLAAFLVNVIGVLYVCCLS